MHKKTSFGYLSVFSVLFVLFGVTGTSAFAQTAPSGTFVVRPAKAEVAIAPGETQTVLLRLSNGTPIPLHIETSFEDVASQTQTSPVENPIQLLGETTGAYSLKDALSVSRTSFDLLSLKDVVVPIQISIPKNALPGGRYGSVVFLFRPAISGNTAENSNVAVESRVAVLLYVRITGSVKEEGKLAAFGIFNDARIVSAPSQQSPLRFQVAYENTGDVYLNPHGKVVVKGMFGRTETLEVDPFAVLPSQIRMREIDLFAPLSLGYYSAELTLSRGYGETIDTKQVHFFVLPTGGVLLVILGAGVLLFFLIRRSLRLSRGSFK